LLKTFREYPPLNPNGLPFGMVMDSYHNLWVAEHTINKIAVIDPRTGANKEVTIPNQSPFVQWVTADSKGNVWLAEQRGSSLAAVTSTPKLGQQPDSANPVAATNQVNNSNNNNNPLGFPQLGLSYATVVGPAISGGIIVCALFYTKSIVDLKQSIRQVSKGHKNK
jgi:copper transport protein